MLNLPPDNPDTDTLNSKSETEMKTTIRKRSPRKPPQEKIQKLLEQLQKEAARADMSVNKTISGFFEKLTERVEKATEEGTYKKRILTQDPKIRELKRELRKLNTFSRRVDRLEDLARQKARERSELAPLKDWLEESIAALEDDPTEDLPPRPEVPNHHMAEKFTNHESDETDEEE